MSQPHSHYAPDPVLGAEPVRASKARAVWWLGLAAVLTGPLVGGVVPGTVALVLAGQFRREAYPAGGYLTGASLVRRGERLAWVGIVLAVAAALTLTTIGVLQFVAGPTGPEYGPGVN